MPNRLKRVLLMVSSMRGGGSERQVLLLAQSLDRSRFQPHLYLTEAVGSFLDQVPDDVIIDSFDTCPDPGGIYVPGRQLRRQTEFLKQVIERRQIDVVYDRTFHMSLIADKAASGRRRVSTIVSPPHLALPLVEKRFVALKRRRLAASYRRSDVVVAVSRQAALSAESYYGLADGSVVVIKNPVDADALRAAAGSCKVDRPGQTTLVCVGRMTEEKGHADLIDALAIVRDRWPAGRLPLAVRLIGDGPQRASLEEQVETRRLVDVVEFVGPLENAAGEIASADALVLPSRFEGMPNVVLESMALGTPVIASRAGGTIELQRDEATAFWAEPGDAYSLSNAILQFAADSEQASRHRDAASRLIHSEHDLHTTIKRVEDLLMG